MLVFGLSRTAGPCRGSLVGEGAGVERLELGVSPEGI